MSFEATRTFPGMPLELLAAHGGIEDGQWIAPLTTYVVALGGRTLVIDTGLGPSLGHFSGATGALPAALQEGGVDTARVDAVVLTHLHSDHIGWIFSDVNGERRPTFANARYVISRAEWAHWQSRDADRIARTAAPLAAAGQLDLVEDGHEPVPGMRLLATPGHTPGHVSVLLCDGGVGAVITGDAVYNPAQLEQPQWSPRTDTDAALAARSREALAERIADEGLIVLGGHFPPPMGGRLLRVEQRRVYRPLGG
jgi:glyoxylase-like metal-dependent hydrolase (beta-lactamase superfamily II)